MCSIDYKGNLYNGEYVSFPCPTMEYLVVTLDPRDDLCIVGRTLEDCELASEYYDKLMLVDGRKAIIIREVSDIDDALRIADRYAKALSKNAAKDKKVERRKESRDCWRIFRRK